MYDHLAIGVRDLERSAAFYDAVLGALGRVRLFANPRAVCYGPAGWTGEYPFAIIQHGDDAHPPGAGFHLAFTAPDRSAVNAFFAEALAHGGTDDGPPGIRARYGPGYYAAFVLDPDGHRLEAVVHEVEAGQPTRPD